jgi:hypothetical protein
MMLLGVVRRMPEIPHVAEFDPLASGVRKAGPAFSVRCWHANEDMRSIWSVPDRFQETECEWFARNKL